MKARKNGKFCAVPDGYVSEKEAHKSFLSGYRQGLEKFIAMAEEEKREQVVFNRVTYFLACLGWVLFFLSVAF